MKKNILLVSLLSFFNVCSVSAAKVSCGNITDIPSKLPYLSSLGITLVQIAVPVILVIMGMMDLFKGITSSKEDEIKKGLKVFAKRAIVALIIFFIVVLVKLIISLVAGGTSQNIVECIDCFISNNCKSM